MILAIDARELSPCRETGIGRYLGNVLAEIAAHRPHVQAIALTSQTVGLPVQAAHLSARRLRGRPTLLWDQVCLPLALRTMGAQVFFSPYYKAPLLSACPSVVTIHDLIPLRFPAYREGRLRLRAAAFRGWAAVLARRAAVVVTDSEHSRADLVALLGLPPERIRVIPIGVGPEYAPGPPAPEVAATAARYHIDRPYLLSVGNFLPHKNLPRLVDAYGRLPAPLRERFRLVLAGRPGNLGRTPAVPAEALAKAGVILTGFVPRRDLPLLYAGATALVCPSLLEGFGLPVLEAMACGTPTVCARAGALPEVAGDAALYVEPTRVESIAEGLRQILEDPQLRTDLASRGLARAGQFEARNTTGRLVDLLEQAADGGRADSCPTPGGGKP